MNIHNKNIVITGAANGIGYALAKRINKESPKSISLIDISENFLMNLFIFKYAIPISKLNIFLQ